VSKSLEEQDKNELIQEVLRSWEEIRQLENYIKRLQQQNRELQRERNNVK
jgi:uncharacterized membrane protein (DUF106 family)